MSSHSFTYQTRLNLGVEALGTLGSYAANYGRIERKLYAEMQRNSKPAVSFKNEYLVQFGITARQFNAIARNLEGKMKSVLELLPLRIQEKELAIAKAVKVIAKSKNKNKAHQKKRRLVNLQGELAELIEQKKVADPRICFGGRRLFRQQFNLEINGYMDHSEWKDAWQAKRSSQFFVLGSKDETGGCQGCVMTANLDGTFNFRLRLMGKESRYLELKDITIKYGADVIREALRKGQALSYRFMRDSKGWRVLTATDGPEIKTVSIKESGKIGIDINHDCLAVTEIDRFGNLVGTRVISLVLYGKNTDQAKALIGEVVKEVVSWATAVAKPIVVEKLDFRRKKAELESEHPGYSRMLSSFACNQVISHLHSAAYRAGIEVIEVNPTYTSTIGAVNYAKKLGISVHQGAAYAIARRGSGFRERQTGKAVTIPTSQGDHVTFDLPVRNRSKHVWSFWSTTRKILIAVLAAHARSPQGDPSSTPAKRKSPAFTVKSRDASRPQLCSAGAIENIPW